MVDYLSGDVYEAERSSRASASASTPVPAHSSNQNSVPPPAPALSSSPDDFINPTASMFAPKPVYDEPAPTSKSADHLPSAPWDVPPATNLPPPPSRYNQRQQFFEQSQTPGGGPSRSSSESGSSYDSLVGQTQNLSLKSPTPSKPEQPEDALFRDLVDFAKSKSSSPKPNRSYWCYAQIAWLLALRTPLWLFFLFFFYLMFGPLVIMLNMNLNFWDMSLRM